MKIDTIVTLEDDERYILTEETEQNGEKYFLAIKLDEQDEPTDKGCIFKEEQEGEDFYLEEVTDQNILQYLTAIFVTKFNDLVENLDINEDDEEAM